MVLRKTVLIVSLLATGAMLTVGCKARSGAGRSATKMTQGEGEAGQVGNGIMEMRIGDSGDKVKAKFDFELFRSQVIEARINKIKANQDAAEFANTESVEDKIVSRDPWRSFTRKDLANSLRKLTLMHIGDQIRQQNDFGFSKDWVSPVIIEQNLSNESIEQVNLFVENNVTGIYRAIHLGREGGTETTSVPISATTCSCVPNGPYCVLSLNGRPIEMMPWNHGDGDCYGTACFPYFSSVRSNCTNAGAREPVRYGMPAPSGGYSRPPAGAAICF